MKITPTRIPRKLGVAPANNFSVPGPVQDVAVPGANYQGEIRPPEKPTPKTAGYSVVNIDLRTRRTGDVFFAVPGNMFWFKDVGSVDLAVEIEVRFSLASSPRLTMRPGESISGLSFTGFYLNNDTLDLTAQIVVTS